MRRRQPLTRLFVGPAARPIAAAGLLAALALAPHALGAEAKAPANPHGAFVQECSQCHAADSWSPARIGPQFNHAKLGFPLDGAHARAACRSCHTTLDFTKEKVRTDCVACHADVHLNEFGTDCARCHSTRSFIDHLRMLRAHNLTRFPLVGAHRTADCTACHPPAPQGQMTYVNTRIDCEACHLETYLATTSPDHETAGFPRTCEMCHVPTRWIPSRAGTFLQHDGLYFPIYSGRHRGKWSTCTDCHTNPNNYTDFTCIQCHEHSNQTEVNGKHGGVGGYTYTPTSCYTCHPTGNAG